MSVALLLAVTAAVAASMGYMASKKHGPDLDEGGDLGRRRHRDDEEEPPREKPAPKPAKRPLATNPFADLPLALGDVVSSGTEERWLAGALVAREGGRVVSALFLAPEGAVNKAVAVFAPPRKDIWWMSPVTVASPDEPPATLEIGGAAISRKGRLPVALERLGQGAPSVGADGLWAVYDRGRDVALVIRSGSETHAWSGVRLEEDEYDRLGGGGD